eukprot:COSAG06_NODE_1861_length_8199_cov_18.090247_1_plen_54_part_10
MTDASITEMLGEYANPSFRNRASTMLGGGGGGGKYIHPPTPPALSRGSRVVFCC